MTEKLRYNISNNTLISAGQFDEITALGVSQKGKLVSSSGDFIGLGFDEEEDILITSGNFPSDGQFTGSWGTYTQSNISVTAGDACGKDGNKYAYVIKRSPDIDSSSTWGGVRLLPPETLQRISNAVFRFSYDYRGYSGGYSMDNYQSVSIGWSNLGVNLPYAWTGPHILSFDTDWEWLHYEKEFTVTDSLLNVIAGNYDWDSNTQYPDGYYGIRYNGDLYRHRTGWTIPTLGVDPETEYQAGGVYAAKWVGGASAGYFNVYDQIKIGFNYHIQNARGTHVHVDNITLTNITDNQTWKYDISTGTWVSENLIEQGLDILAKGTAYVGIARSDTGGDVFAVEGSRYVSINGIQKINGTGRGLNLLLFDSSGTVISNNTYDTHGSTTAIASLATALSQLSTEFWCLTSFDAIGSESIHNSEPSLRDQLVSMKSRMWNFSDAVYLWAISSGQTRNPYAAVGKGQRIIKEDGANAIDDTYKRKGVVQLRID